MEELRGLSCLVCYNTFTSTQDQSIPRNLSCGHTFCTACLERLAKQCHGLYVQCPACKCQTLLQNATPAKGVKSLPKNFGVLEIIEFREGNTSKSPEKPGLTEIQKDKTRHKCEEHDEAKKVYCYTDECLICIYCQIYGEHQGHKCELASDLAKSCRTELEGMAQKLEHEITRLNEAKTTLATTKSTIVNRQQFLKERIKKYISLLQYFLSRREALLVSSVDDLSACKLQALEAQEKKLYEFSTRSEELYMLIKTVQRDNDSGVIEEKHTLERLVDGMLCVAQACQVQPQAQDNLTFSWDTDIVKMLEKSVGAVVDMVVKDEEQTDSSDSNKQLSLDTLIQNLEKEIHPNEPADSDAESSESDDDEGWVSVDSSTADEDVEVVEDESRAEADDEPASESELVGAVGGNALPEAQQGEREKHDKDINKKQGLLRELQHEIERLRLLGPRGDVIRVVDDTSSSSDESDDETADGDTPSLQLDLQITVNNNDLSWSKSRASTSSATQGLAASDNRLSCDRQRNKSEQGSQPTRKHCCVNCQYHAKPTLQCKHCCRVFCQSCAELSLTCNRSESGHEFVKYGQHRNKNIKDKHSRTKQQRSRREHQWECKRCTMVNEGHVLVCGACETSKDFDPNEVRNVCPMCTLVNEPGKTNCELCDTDLEESI